MIKELVERSNTRLFDAKDKRRNPVLDERTALFFEAPALCSPTPLEISRTQHTNTQQMVVPVHAKGEFSGISLTDNDSSNKLDDVLRHVKDLASDEMITSAAYVASVSLVIALLDAYESISSQCGRRTAIQPLPLCAVCNTSNLGVKLEWNRPRKAVRVYIPPNPDSGDGYLYWELGDDYSSQTTLDPWAVARRLIQFDK